MFERNFRSIGEFIVRNRKKILVFWVIFFLIMLPFATMFFSDVSYNLSSDIVPTNSQSYRSQALLSQYFPSTNSSNSSSLVVVTTGTNVNTQSAQLIALQNSLKTGLKNSSYHFQSVESIFTIEKGILSNFSFLLSEESNFTYPLLNSTNANLYGLISGYNATGSLIFGIPLIYLENFTTVLKQTQNPFKSNSEAYNYTGMVLAYSHSIIGTSYLNNFSRYWNHSLLTQTVNVSSNPLPYMNGAVNSTILSTWPENITGGNQEQIFIYRSLDQNVSLSQYANPTIFNNEITQLSVSVTAGGLQENAQANGFITDHLYMSPGQFVLDALNIDLNPQYQFLGRDYVLLQESTNVVINSIRTLLNGNPLVEVNSNNTLVQNYAALLRSKDGNINQSVNVEMNNVGFWRYPFLPTPFVAHQMIGYDNTTTLIIVNFQNSFGIDLVNQATAITVPFQNSIRGSSYYVAGGSAFSSELEQESMTGLITALVLGVMLSVVIVGVFFRSPIAAFIPLLLFMFSAIIGMGINGLLYEYVIHSKATFITPTLLLILLLGLTTDYAVYIMARYRRELRKGNGEAVLNASQWAGHAVFTSGITVTVAYLILWLSNVPIFSGSGLTNAIGIAFTIVIAETMLISLLALGGERIFWPSKPSRMTHAAMENGMKNLGSYIVRNRNKVFVVFVVVTLAALYVYSVTPVGMNIFALLPASSGIDAIQIVNGSFHGDFFERNFIVLSFASPLLLSNGSYNTTEMAVVTQVENELSLNSGITQVYGPTYPYGYYVSPDFSGIPSSQVSNYTSYINQNYISQVDSRYAVIDFQMGSLAYSQNAISANSLIPSELSSISLKGFNFYVGGITQGLSDANSFTHSTFIDIVPILAISIFVILLIQLSSVFTPIRLILMVIATVIMSLVLTYILFYYIGGVPLLIFLPLFTFITLLAVGMDYDIFMITRVREEVMKGKTTEEAIRTSMAENGGVIVTLGLILFVTFFALDFTGIEIIQEIGVGVAMGVIFDTAISWPFFVPAVMLILKKYNWWPSRLGNGK